MQVEGVYLVIYLLIIFPPSFYYLSLNNFFAVILQVSHCFAD